MEKTKEKMGTRLFHRASHVVSEMARVESFSQALIAGDLDELGHIMRTGHESLRDDFEVSCVELDALVDAAYAIGKRGGVVGSRMTGGGFGGSTVSLVKTESAAEVKRSLEDFYQEKFGRDLNCFITTAVDGAHLVPSA
jgi:galactokinase